jgi:hypothetical protein
VGRARVRSIVKAAGSVSVRIVRGAVPSGPRAARNVGRAKVGVLRAKVGVLRAKVGVLRAKVGVLRAKVGVLRAKAGVLRAKRARRRGVSDPAGYRRRSGPRGGEAVTELPIPLRSE